MKNWFLLLAVIIFTGCIDDDDIFGPGVAEDIRIDYSINDQFRDEIDNAVLTVTDINGNPDLDVKYSMDSSAMVFPRDLQGEKQYKFVVSAPNCNPVEEVRLTHQLKDIESFELFCGEPYKFRVTDSDLNPVSRASVKVHFVELPDTPDETYTLYWEGVANENGEVTMRVRPPSDLVGTGWENAVKEYDGYYVKVSGPGYRCAYEYDIDATQKPGEVMEMSLIPC